MKRLSRLLLVIMISSVLLGGALALSAAPAGLEPAGLLLPLGPAQTNLREAYGEALAHIYDGGRLHWVAGDPESLPETLQPGDFYLPPGEFAADFCAACTRREITSSLALDRAYALSAGRVAVLRSTTMVNTEYGEMVAMWELAEIRQVLEGYLGGAVPYDVLTEDAVAAGLDDYDLLIVPAFRLDAYDEVIGLLAESGALDAMHAFVDAGGTLYAQSSGLFVAQEAELLPNETLDRYATLSLYAADAFANRGVLSVVQPDAPLAYSWLTETLYILDDPLINAGEDPDLEVIAEIVNVEQGPHPAVIRYAAGQGQVLGVVGHPTDATRRSQIPLFMDALLSALAGRSDFYGDAIQTFNPLYPAHEFPAYEEVPVSATLHVENLWDVTLAEAVVTETLSPGYVLSDTCAPTPTAVLTDAAGFTHIVWQLGDLQPHAALTLCYTARTAPDVLAAGVGTFSTGELVYSEPSGERLSVAHRPFELTARMAARLLGDRGVEADRHYRIPEDGLYLDMALPLENKEETPAYNITMTDWVYLIAPIVDIENQHVILNANDGETIWIRNEPYLWGDEYPLPNGASAPTQTFTLADWQGDWCVFTSSYGIHIDPPITPLLQTEDYGSFISIPPELSDYVTVTAQNELLLPCLPLTWDLGNFHGYWYEEPAVRYGVHSSEFFERLVVFDKTPREDAVVMPYDAGSIYVGAGEYPVPYREYLPDAQAYSAVAPTPAEVTWQDVWSRTAALPLRAAFYDVWDSDSCATCGAQAEQHAGFAVTFGIWADLDDDGAHETLVNEIPTRLNDAQLQLLGKTYSDRVVDGGSTIPMDENLIDLPVFHGLGIKIGPQGASWYDSWRSAGPGSSALVHVTSTHAYDHLYFQQEIPPGSWASFVVSATIENYPFNREGLYKLHDGGRLVYHQILAGPNSYEVYDAHVQVAEGWRSDATVSKRAGPIQVSVYSDTLIFLYNVSDPYDPRPYDRFYDPYIKSWGYGDLVWTTYAGGREEKTLFHTTLDIGEMTRVRESLDNNTGVTLTNLSVSLDPPPGISVTWRYASVEDPAPEPIWPELAFLNRTQVPDAWRSVWYFDITVTETLSESLWGQVIEIPVLVSADNLPDGYVAPPVRIALQRPGDAQATFVSGLGSALVFTDALPADVVLESVVLISDTTALEAALDADAGQVLSDTAGSLFDTLAPTLPFTLANGVFTVTLPEALRTLPSAAGDLQLAAKATLVRAQHGPNVVNSGAGICYRGPFGIEWCDQSDVVTVEAHGAAVWVDYYCDGGWAPSSLVGTRHVFATNGQCYIPSEAAEVVLDVTGSNVGDAIARGVTVTLELPLGVTVTQATPAYLALGEHSVTWALGDLAPGAWQQFEVVFYVEPDEGGGEDESESEEGRLAVHHTDGVFYDDYSKQIVSGQVGSAHWFGTFARRRAVYLPLLLRAYDERPDLRVEIVALDVDDPSAVVLRVANVGLEMARAGAWVDIYLDPSAAPTNNHPWPMLSAYGATWQLAQPLAAGEMVTLTLGDANYDADASRWPEEAYPSGEHSVWAYVDSWSDQAWGWINEAHEDNNVAGPQDFSIDQSLTLPASDLPSAVIYLLRR